MLDAKGIVTRRLFEELYNERATADSLLPQIPDRATSSTADKTETPHLTVTTSVSDRQVAPGTRFSLYVDVTPKPKMHVYSPEQKDYISIALTLEPDAAFKSHAAVYPKAEKFFFAPLQETQLVYSKPFRVVQDATISLYAGPDQRHRCWCRADRSKARRSGLRRQSLLPAQGPAAHLDGRPSRIGEINITMTNPRAESQLADSRQLTADTDKGHRLRIP